jgi:hypothetical protein
LIGDELKNLEMHQTPLLLPFTRLRKAQDNDAINRSRGTRRIRMEYQIPRLGDVCRSLR